MTGDEWMKQKLVWRKTSDALHPLSTIVDGQRLRLRVGDFPEESLYTLLIGEQAIVAFDNWPEAWSRP